MGVRFRASPARPAQDRLRSLDAAVEFRVDRVRDGVGGEDRVVRPDGDREIPELRKNAYLPQGLIASFSLL
jgi:hypothetical protein